MSELALESREEVLIAVAAMLETASQDIAELFPRMHKRPLLGGVFGSAGFLLCSYVYTQNRLQEVRYYVCTEHGLFLGCGVSKGEALRMARNILTALPQHQKTALVAEFKAKFEARELDRMRRMAEAALELSEARKPAKVRSIGRRRQRIFEESEGKCHYCATVLTLDGKWHIEHKHPKALGGSNEPGNLVASCVPCNMKKRDTTDHEFKSRLAKEAAA